MQNMKQLVFFCILEEMLQQEESTNIYLSTWNTKQVEYFIQQTIEKGITLDSKQNRIILSEAVTTYACLLATYTTQMVRQRLQINKNSKKRYGPPTCKQAMYEQRHGDTWADYEKRIYRFKKAKKKHKLTPKQLLINDKKFNLIQNKNRLERHNNIYERPIHTCAEKSQQSWTNTTPYLEEGENQGAKIENQYQRYLSYQRSRHPRKPTVPTSTIMTEIEQRKNKKTQRLTYLRLRRRLLLKPEFRMMFCEHHGLDYNDLSTNNAPLPPPLLDPG